MLPIMAILEANTYLYIGIGGTALFVIKLILFMMGGDHGGHGDSHDFGSGGHHDLGHADGGSTDHVDSTATFNVFTIQGFLAFLMGFGWMGYAAYSEWLLGDTVSVLLAAGFGFSMMLFSAALMFYARRMEKTIPFDMRAAVGQTGEVQLHIPAAGGGLGEVQLVVQGRQKVVKARTVGGEIKSFTRVKVVAVENDRVLTVEPA